MVDINDKATDHSALNEVEALQKRVKEHEAQLLKTENDGLETRFPPACPNFIKEYIPASGNKNHGWLEYH